MFFGIDELSGVHVPDVMGEESIDVAPGILMCKVYGPNRALRE